jgi:hypothetical protein
MLLASSCSFDPNDPLDEGLELPLRKLFKGLESRPGDFGAVKGENPDGGLAVRITGGLAASSSSDSSSGRSRREGCSYAP